MFPNTDQTCSNTLQLFVGTHLGNLVEALEEELEYCWWCDALERQAK